MKKVSNTFNKGLTMDVSPLSTTGDSLSDCLNGTFCTMNGDELVLQNDMGNGRVQTAYLPEGYIPIGTTQLGGIIYVASYNPFTNKCQIGSFPSPQRTSDKRDTISKEIPLDKDEDITRVVLSDQIFKPGDKFYLTMPEQYMQYKYTEASNTIDAVKQHFLKFSVAIISEESQIIKLDEDPIIQEPTGNHTEDDFHKNINNFKVCTSKISGKLILIIERVTFDYSINFNAFSGISANNSNPTFYLNFNLNANSQDKFFPNRLVLESSAKYNDKSYGQTLTFPKEGEFTSGNYNNFHSFDYTAKNIYNTNVVDPVIVRAVNKPQGNGMTIQNLISMLTDPTVNYWGSPHNPIYLKIDATLYTNNFKINSNGEKIGECLPTATKQYVIDLSKVASNTVELSRYTYIINEESSTSVEITFELKTYLDSKYEIKDTTVTIYNVKDDSVNRIYSEPLGKNIRPVDFTNLENNYLYLVEFQIKTGRIEKQDGSFDEKIINIYRYLYSNRSIVTEFSKKRFTDYGQAVPELTLQAKINQADNGIKFNQIQTPTQDFPNGLANTEKVFFTGKETHKFNITKNPEITISSESIPIKVDSILVKSTNQLNSKEYNNIINNTVKIDLDSEEKNIVFDYKYTSSDKIDSTYNIVERVADYLHIDGGPVKGIYPASSTGGAVYDKFSVWGNSYNAITFKKYYTGGNPPDEYNSLYGYKNKRVYTLTYITFKVRGGYGSSQISDNIQNKGQVGTYLVSPGDGSNDMLFALYVPDNNNIRDWNQERDYLLTIFSYLYTFRKDQSISVYYAKEKQSGEETKTITVQDTINVSNISVDLYTDTGQTFYSLAEIYNKKSNSNSYKKPTTKELNINIQNQLKLESKLPQNYKITLNSPNEILVKTNNKLYMAMCDNLSETTIYNISKNNLDIEISDKDINIPLDSTITYKGVKKQFYAKNGKLYMKEPISSHKWIMMHTSGYPYIQLDIQTCRYDEVISQNK